MVLALVGALQAGAATSGFYGAGPKLSFVGVEHYGAGVGWGGHVLFRIDLGRAGALDIYPNLEMWFSGDDHKYRHWNWWYEQRILEIAVNLDARYAFPVPGSVPVKPFAGMGVAAPVIDVYSVEWHDIDDPNFDRDYYADDDTDVDAGFNFFGGIDFPMGYRHMGFVELRGKIGGPDVFKLTFGVLFRGG
jgi:hypothetical protein